ncbi:MAG: rhodanese-like domain-containing protein [Bacteroidales bacterium]|nr:rhodanese-like domain-containing protein [Bacteroidales bacterium]MDY0285516.1 rhodanese-like domain-containing protein [Bacteroidales bacterium]HPE87277.1 rhodanese-like domain-containing protein [Bacteroidales bacterium]
MNPTAAFFMVLPLFRVFNDKFESTHMNELEKVIEKMDFQFFATGQHKVDPETLLQNKEAVLLDVRSKEEIETVQFHLKHHVQLLEIPAHEVPSRVSEIPKQKFIGIFCSSGIRCTMIFLYLQSKGFSQVRILEGGYYALISALMPGKIYKQLNK